MRPDLTKQISIKSFKEYYWLKEELQTFCRTEGLSTAGPKVEISNRVETYLETGEILQPTRKTKVKNESCIELSLDTVITANHRCSQEVRSFFKTIIPNFHFSTYIQNFFKANVGRTYRDVEKAWHDEEVRRKDPTYKKEIGSQFEYNRFTRDFFADPCNKGKTREDAIHAWNTIKSLPGSNTYTPTT
ncbi:cytoplasmic protein [Fictibacillus nanhaiensis]|uniref:Cytoplasmic protein n=1 Tax=Fictibacillus nanhaiensis TaxID=742169 RepID=A0ABS2ZUK0_9BACL|nr:cytoplasmic protein [Fictibacillus nanhaiensis]